MKYCKYSLQSCLFKHWNVSVISCESAFTKACSLLKEGQEKPSKSNTNMIFFFVLKKEYNPVSTAEKMSSLCWAHRLHSCGSLSTGVSNLKSGGKSSAARG